MPFTLNSIPRHHFHLGEYIFLVVSEFGGKIGVHLRMYERNGSGLFPTKQGITISPRTFLEFREIIYRVNDGGTWVVNSELFITSIASEGISRYQKMYVDHLNYAHLIAPGMLLNFDQFSKLSDVIDPAWESIQTVMFGNAFRQRFPALPDCLIQRNEEEMNRILLETLKTEVLRKVDEVFVCPLTDQPQNQLGHTCVITSRGAKLQGTFDKIVASFQPVFLARKFQEAGISRKFVTSLNGVDIFKAVKEMCEEEEDNEGCPL